MLENLVSVMSHDEYKTVESIQNIVAIRQARVHTPTTIENETNSQLIVAMNFIVAETSKQYVTKSLSYDDNNICVDWPK